jgi:hypothetical protein
MYNQPERSSNWILIAIILAIAGLTAYIYIDRERVGRWFSKDVIEG